MAEWTIYALNPRGALHLGRRGVGSEETACHVPADTLFAALVATWVDAGGQADDWGRAFPQGDQRLDPPFLLTSALPFAGGVRFYPVPQIDLTPLGIDTDDRRKDLRQVTFVSEGIFRRMVTGKSLADYLPPAGGDPEKGVFVQGKTLWLTAGEVQHLPEAMRCFQAKEGRVEPRPLRALQWTHVWQTARVPRVTVDRIGSSSTLFHVGRVAFAPGCGLWFGAQWRQPDAALDGGAIWRAAFERTLSLLGDAGLGGSRAVGCGPFAWLPGGTVSWPSPEPGQPYVTLSRYHPRPAETPEAFARDPAAYALVAVAGYLQSPEDAAQRRRRLWLAAEGSVLRAVGDAPYGNLTDVRPQVGQFAHPVWRYGLASPVAIKEVDRV